MLNSDLMLSARYCDVHPQILNLNDAPTIQKNPSAT